MDMIVSLVLLMAQDMSKTPDVLERNNSLVSAWATKECGEGPAPAEVKGVEKLQDFVGGKTWHFVHFREYPMAVMPRPPFKSRNVVRVDALGKMKMYAKREELNKEVTQLQMQMQQDQVAEFAVNYLKLSTLFSQDGFFEFVYDKKTVKVNDDGTVVAIAPVVEKAGDMGALKVTFKCSRTQDAGALQIDSIKEEDTVQPGIRPVCQCTLLLDENPIVRKIAERDLLVMGRAAFPYMRQQMETAAPELRKEIERVWKRIERGER